MNRKHTPGPWEVHKIGDGGELGNICDVIVGGNTCICEYAFEHNARLIAAAPDLLEALQAVLEYEDDRVNGPWPQAVAAIKKATGE